MADNNPSRIKCYEEAAQLGALRLPESSGRTCRLLGHKAGGDGTGLTFDGVEVLCTADWQREPEYALFFT